MGQLPKEFIRSDDNTKTVHFIFSHYFDIPNNIPELHSRLSVLAMAELRIFEFPSKSFKFNISSQRDNR